MTQTFLDQCRDRTDNAKLRSDDHGHDCGLLREYCEQELIYAYEVMVPELVRRLEIAIKGLRECAEFAEYEKDLEIYDEIKNHINNIKAPIEE